MGGVPRGLGRRAREVVDGDDEPGGVAPFFKFFNLFTFLKFFKSRLLTGAMDSKIFIFLVIVGGYLVISFSY